jgi:5-methylcytosine-specific restriction protein B
MLDTEAKQLLAFFRKLGSLQIVDQFFYLLQPCLQQLELNNYKNRLACNLDETNLSLYLGSTEVACLCIRSEDQVQLDLIRQADGRLFSYAGAAATPQGYSRLTIRLQEENLSTPLLQEWLQAVIQLASESHEATTNKIGETIYRAAVDASFRKQFLSYLRQDSAYQDLLEELLPNVLQQSSFKKIINSQEFLFQKAIDSFQAFMQMKISPELENEFLTAYENYEGRYDQFVQALAKDHPIKKLAQQIGQLISYVDGKAAGKKIWNQYEDKRTVAVAVVRQNHWVAQLLRYHQQKNSAELSPNMQHAIHFLENPAKYTAVLSAKHRKTIAERLLHKNYQENSFDQQLLQFFSDFDIKTQHPLNFSYLISSILYHPEITELWKKNEEYPSDEGYYPDELYEAEVPYQLFPSREETPLNQILYGPAGTGKTYLSIRIAISIVEGLPLDDILQESAESIRNRFEDYSEEERIALVSFHQAMSYEDFIEGIKPISQDGQLQYQLEDGLFKRLALKASANPNKAYVLIIDEINRGQVASIFGELITLLEEDKRQNAPNALSTILPYSRVRFSVPSNLYLIGSMNTADRGVEALDIALRRRFHFKEIEPQPQLLSKDMMGINLAKLLETVNFRISKLLSPQKAIGHAYFLDVHNLEQLNQCMEYKIIPLLMEYFYHDLAKVGMVLGNSFVEKLSNDIRLADFPQEDYSRNQQQQYRIRKFPHPSIHFQKIYE